MSIESQKQIRENTMELNEYLKDLKGWESTMKENEKKTVNQHGVSKDTGKKNSATTPRRNAYFSTSNSSGNGLQEAEEAKKKKTAPKDYGSSKKAEVENQGLGPSSKKTDRSPASHTYDHARDKWDKFNVEEALKALDDEDEDGRPLAKQPKKEICLPRGSHVKTSGGVKPKSSAVSPSLPPGKAFGGGAQSMTSADLGFDDSPPDANSEKDLGNEYFKESKYVRAIDCYSRSIALLPTAVAYANRAMAAIKIRKFEDAEVDATEAITLDDRYTKAFARRGTARRELKKYCLALDDFEFALQLEPDNKELQKQYNELEELYHKERGEKVPQHSIYRTLSEREETAGQAMVEQGNPLTNPLTGNEREKIRKQQSSSEKSQVASANKLQGPSTPEVFVNAVEKSKPEQPAGTDSSSTTGKPRDAPKDLAEANVPVSSVSNSTRDTVPIVGVHTKHARDRDRKMTEAIAATQAAAARAAAKATAAVSSNLVAPKSSFEFELTWKGFDGNRGTQAQLLKLMDPLSFRKVFKDSLGAPLLLEMIQALELLFPDDAELAVQILENLAKVGRFKMMIMFLTSKDKSGVEQLWQQVFMKSAEKLQRRLKDLQSTYGLN